MPKNERDTDVAVLECNSWPKLFAKVESYPVVLFMLDDSGTPTGAGHGCLNQDEYKNTLSEMLRGNQGLKFRIIPAQITQPTPV